VLRNVRNNVFAEFLSKKFGFIISLLLSSVNYKFPSTTIIFTVITS